MAAPRLLRVRCATWDQVEAFYKRKLRPGGRLTMKVGFATAIGSPVTLVLELPNQIALSVDGEVTGGAEIEGKAVEITLRGLTAELISRLESLVADARAGALVPEAQDEEARLLAARRAELARLRRLPTHEILGVSREPSPGELRGAWLALARREHPDGVARYASLALTTVAIEIVALAGAAYERVRAALVADGRGLAVGATVRSTGGWQHDAGVVAGSLVGERRVPAVAAEVEARRSAPVLAFDAMVSGAHVAVTAPVPMPAPPAVTGDGSRPRATSVVQGIVAEVSSGVRVGAGDRFARQVRQHLALGDHALATNLAEAALQLYPDDRRLRGLLAVAAAMAACARGDRGAAVTALETAIAADPNGGEAATALAELRHVAVPSVAMIQRWFA